MATYTHLDIDGKHLAELARNYLTLTALLNWDATIVKTKHDKGLDPTVGLQALIPGAPNMVMYLPASALTSALQELARNIATELREMGVNLDELLQEYMDRVAPYEEQSKSPLDNGMDLR